MKTVNINVVFNYFLLDYVYTLLISFVENSKKKHNTLYKILKT